MENTGTIVLGLAIEQRIITKWMQACDMYEKFKVACRISVAHLSINGAENLTYENAAKIIHDYSQIKDKEFRIVVAHLIEIVNGDTILRNTKPTVVPYFAPDVKVLSDGRHWWLIDKTLDLFNAMHK